MTRLRPEFLAWLVAAAALALVPLVVTDYFLTAVAIKTLWLGIAAASLIFLAAYGGMVSLAQTALYGVSAYAVADLVVHHGWGPWRAIAAGIVVTVAVGLVLGLVASRSSGIYFLMITFSYAVIVLYFFQQVPAFGGHEGINDVNLPAILGDTFAHRERLYYAALVAAAAVYLLIRYVVRTPFGLALQGVRDDPVRMRAVGYHVLRYHAAARVLRPRFAPEPWDGRVAVLTAGTSDLDAAGEARMVIEACGLEARVDADLGVAGLHRLLRPLADVLAWDPDAVVVAAGMDGVLPGVVAGLLDRPVIGLPVSTGYGHGGAGEAALGTMLQSCSTGLVVVNIDNGVGAGAAAVLIAGRAAAGSRRPRSARARPGPGGPARRS